MKITRIIAVGLAILMLALGLVACDSNGDNPADTTTGQSSNVTLRVDFKVIDVDGKTVYSIENYKYTGKSANLIPVLEDYLYIEEDVEPQYDEYKTLLGIGAVKVGEVTKTAENGDTVVDYYTYWWYRVNGREGSTSMEEYVVQDGDSIEIYVNKKSADAS